MVLRDRLQEDLKTAMRGGDTLVRDTLRMAIAACKNRRIELGEDLGDAEVQHVLQKEVKKREDAAEQFDAGGRPDLAEKERAEAQVLGRYLPQKLSEEETRALVQGLIAELGISQKKDVGVLMKRVMAEHKATVDGKLVQRVAGELLD